MPEKVETDLNQDLLDEGEHLGRERERVLGREDLDASGSADTIFR